jgi:hypothetical protein
MNIRLATGLALALGAALGHLDLRTFAKSEGQPMLSLQKNECKDVNDGVGGKIKMCELKLKPRKMTVEFVTREQFDAMIPKGSTLSGLSRWGRNPCEIVLPIDGATLQSYPYSAAQGVYWGGDNTDMGMVIAHEMLHCYAGAWHPEYYPGVAFRDSIETLRRSDALPLRPIHPGED